MPEISLLNKQDVMRLFNIRDRTFYSWIEKGLLIQIDEENGQKVYDITKALIQKNMSPTDVNALLARPADVNEEETYDVVDKAPTSSTNEMIQNLKHQLETLHAELKDERSKSMELITKFNYAESHQKLLTEIRKSENELMEISKNRENKLLDTFQEKLKEIIVITQEGENQQIEKLMDTLQNVQKQKELQLSKNTRTIAYVFSGIIAMLLVSGIIYFQRMEQISGGIIQDKENEIKARQSQIESKESELKAKASEHKNELLQLMQENESKLKSFQESLTEKMLGMQSSYDLKLEKEKKELTNMYTEFAKSYHESLNQLTKERDEQKSQNNDLKLKMELMDMKIRKKLDDLLSEKKNSSKDKEDLEALKKELLDLKASFDESLNHTKEVPVLEDSVE